MKMLFLTHRRENPSTRWRVLQFLPYFERQGVQCVVEEVPSGMLARLSQAGHATRYDVVVVHKRLMPRQVAIRFRKMSKKLIYDFDDVVTVKRLNGTVHVSPTRERRFRRILEKADVVFAATEPLAELARRSAPVGEVVVLPTPVDLGMWKVRPRFTHEGSVTLGWMGPPSHAGNLHMLRDPLARLYRRHPNIRLRLICAERIDLPGIPVDWYPYDLEREGEHVLAMDIGLLPLVEDACTRNKVPTRLLTYMATALPVVASDVPTHRGILQDGINGYLAGTLGQWEKDLECLFENSALWEQLGRGARSTVEEHYSLERIAARYLEVVSNLLITPAETVG